MQKRQNLKCARNFKVMGKKSKAGKKAPKGPVIHEGETEFVFPNGDRYVGGYCAHISGVVWRQGRGVYVTHDGQIYAGEWKDDKLNEQENLEIIYQNGDRYIGRIGKYKYNGAGTYIFKNGSRLTANFVNNKPTEDIIFIDYRENMWEGRADEGADQILLFKEHVFSSELDIERGKGVPKFPEIKKNLSRIDKANDNKSSEVDMKELEKKIFAKTKKTPDTIDFEHSDWFRDFKKYEEIFKIVLPKISEGVDISELDANEKEWLEKYLESAEILKKYKNKVLPQVTCDLLEQFYSNEFRNSCPPLRVFYPSKKSSEQGEG